MAQNSGRSTVRITHIAWIFQKRIELLEWVKDKAGIGNIKAKKNYKPDIHENLFAYTVRYNDAITLLTTVEPYLVIKQKKTEHN